MREPRSATQGEASGQFKNFVAFLIGALALFRLLMSWCAQDPQPISDGLMLVVTLVLIIYLWLCQSRTLRDLQAAQARLATAQTATIAALAKTIEAKDPYTRGHSVRVAGLAIELARKLQLSEDVVAVVKRAALLHDIGKLGISDDILYKKSPLTHEEWETLQQHPRWTNDILSPLPFLKRESRIALLHHERYDGTGYGLGLKGDAIPIEASIVALADGFDAMNSARPYRGPMPRAKVIAEITNGRTTQYDPAVVDPFLTLLEDKPELWTRFT